MNHLLPFFEWCDHTAIGEGIRNSRFLFPIIESVHLLALTVLLGAVVALNLRILGLALRPVALGAVARALAPIVWWSLAAIVATGVPLFLSEALKCYDNPPFLFKMAALAAATLFHWIAMPGALRADAGRGRAVCTSVLSLTLWFAVGAAGRAIGFY